MGNPDPGPRRHTGGRGVHHAGRPAPINGLAAAWELNEAGHEVTVLEAKSRPGGRVRTLREPFADDLYAEAGAVGFSETYAQANCYIDELGLERADWAQPDLPALYYVNGERFAAGEDEPTDWPYDLNEEEQGLGPVGLLQRYFFETLPPEIAEPEAWDQPPRSGRHFERRLHYGPWSPVERSALRPRVALLLPPVRSAYRLRRPGSVPLRLARQGLGRVRRPIRLPKKASKRLAG